MKQNIYIRILIISLLLITNGCKNEIDPITGKPKVYEADNRKRIRDSVENKGTTLFGGSDNKGNTNYEFSTSNVMWRASLEVLNFMPLQSVSYSGGLIITDWYEGQNEAIKIEINFKSSEVAVNSIVVKSFKRSCKNSNDCRTLPTSENFNNNIKNQILSKARALNVQKAKIKKN